MAESVKPKRYRRYSGRMDFDLHEMLVLRSQGVSTFELGRRYGKDHSTIVYHCQKHGIHPAVPVTRGVSVLKRVEPKPPIWIADKYIDLMDEPLNPGKSYKKYLEEEKARKRGRLTKGG